MAKDENKDYYKDVIILSERIQKLHDFIKKMRKEEFEIFEEKFKYGIKNTKTKNSMIKFLMLYLVVLLLNFLIFKK